MSFNPANQAARCVYNTEGAEMYSKAWVEQEIRKSVLPTSTAEPSLSRMVMTADHPSDEDTHRSMLLAMRARSEVGFMSAWGQRVKRGGNTRYDKPPLPQYSSHSIPTLPISIPRPTPTFVTHVGFPSLILFNWNLSSHRQMLSSMG